MSAFGGKADIGWIAVILVRGHFGDSDVADVAKLALAGLVQQADRCVAPELAAIACQGGEDPLATEEDEETFQPVE